MDGGDQIQPTTDFICHMQNILQLNTVTEKSIGALQFFSIA